MKLHILGIAGTFMSGIAVLAKELGFEVTGSDSNIYPPMSTQLQNLGIEFEEGYSADHIDSDVDLVIVGNVIKRGNPAIEHVLNQQIPYISGPLWLYDHVLKNRCVIAIAGTHGKTTTTSLVSWILEYAGLHPGFLIGGVPENFGVSARIGSNPFFVIEADEYDSAFFDKRAKFVNYHPNILVLNNLEFDHADIYPDINAIKQQFIYLLRIVPANGQIIANLNDTNLNDILDPKAAACFSPVSTFGHDNGDWHAFLNVKDGSSFKVVHQNEVRGEVNWALLGSHNVNNALASIASAYCAGVSYHQAMAALGSFKNVKRRLEVKACVKNITIYDDFAHHPTAIATTLEGLRAKIGQKTRLFVILEFGSFTMRTGFHKEKIKQALSEADEVICKTTEIDWGLNEVLQQFKNPAKSFNNVDNIVNHLLTRLLPGDHVVVMSNSGFGGIHDKLTKEIERGLT